MAAKPQIDYEELKRGGIVKLKEKDMFSIWVKTACCNLNSKQLRKLADIAEKYAQGFLLFTTRQTPHIPFVNLRDMDEVKKELAQVYLELDRCGSRVRNINVCYEDKICPEAVTNCISLAEKLDNFFYDPILHKIKIGVAGCRKDCIVSRILSDIGFVGVDGVGKGRYEVYVGGRLGLNPFIGIKMGECLSEEECIKFVQNCFDLLRKEGKEGERMADLIDRIGEEKVKEELNKNLQERSALEPIPCKTHLTEKESDKIILRIQATCGEVFSRQLRKIADIAERYGRGFVHFVVRGCPEVPCIEKSKLEDIRKELQEVELQILDRGIDNLQTCYGSYCTESNMDTQSLLRRIENMIKELDLTELKIKISATGCPNSCGIAHLSDIGFMGIIEPEVYVPNCNGCGLCLPVCKRKAIEIKDKTAIIDKKKCRYCGQCIVVCPFDAINEKRKGFAILVGGREGEYPRLGEIIAEFLSEEETLQFTERCLRMVKEKKVNIATIVDEKGIEGLKQMLV